MYVHNSQMHATGLPEELSPPCELCPVLGGARKRTESGGYVHLLCALWTPGVTFGNVDTLEPVEGVAKVGLCCGFSVSSKSSGKTRAAWGLR